MKRILVLMACFLLFQAISISHAVTIESQKVLLDISEDGSVKWTVTFEYPEYTSKSDYFVLSTISDVSVTGEQGRLDCDVRKSDLGTSIVCDNIHEKKITYSFAAQRMVKPGRTVKMFSYSFPITDIINRFEVTAKLPLASGIIEKEKLEGTGLKPFSPENGEEGSDGRRIYVKWVFNNPTLGKAIGISVIYEPVFEFVEIVIIAITVVVILIMIFSVLFFKRRGAVKDVLPVLNEPERKVMEMVLKSKGSIDQRNIVRELDYSKSKISRTIQSLEQRGLIKTTKRGRSNKITLAFKKGRKEKKS
ncbi:MAG: winged helix-turn-helix transcriptional regulator [Candidatus Aenigmarchaeota archaeon]|nr:winged helix-turn-helix transcriptional regulator [Candidatus Aenigmarchaeota archaeon]